MKTLLIDNYDSFTFNLFQDLAVVNGAEPLVVKNDELTWAEVEKLAFDNIVISPGPGHPGKDEDFGLSQAAIAHARVPLLGVCLGHQGIGLAYGARVSLATEPMHGRPGEIHHEGEFLFKGIPSPFTAIRYHSLIVESPLPEELEATAWTSDGILMSLRHRTRPLWGVQFHPESIGTEFGRKIIENFRTLTEMHLRSTLEAPTSRQATPSATTSRSLTEASVTPRTASSLRVHVKELSIEADSEGVFLSAFSDDSHAFWLDSASKVAGYSRFSFLGDARGPLSEVIRYRVHDRQLIVHRHGQDHPLAGNLFEYLRHALAERSVANDTATPSLPFDFVGGYVGYLGYEMRYECTGASQVIRHRSPTDDASWIFADRFVAIDHLEKKSYLIQLIPTGLPLSDEALDWERRLTEIIVHSRSCPVPAFQSTPPSEIELRHSRTTILEQIASCLEAIRYGESYELCLTNAVLLDRLPNPLETYRKLRRLNPAPYGAFLRFGGLEVLSSSPERFLKIDPSGRMEAKPIKGTAPRGATLEEDQALAEALRTSVKDQAENLMIVDLLRNDLGSVAEVGSVSVPKLMNIESFATVHQLVSTVQAQLKRNLSAIDAIRAVFPGGSMTGAPKKRTMEILDELESSARGIYSGAIGFLSVNGAADLSIVIRTIVNHPGGASIGAGGAIIALSDPESEIEEMLLKAQAPLRAL